MGLTCVWRITNFPQTQQFATHRENPPTPPAGTQTGQTNAFLLRPVELQPRLFFIRCYRNPKGDCAGLGGIDLATPQHILDGYKVLDFTSPMTAESAIPVN